MEFDDILKFLSLLAKHPLEALLTLILVLMAAYGFAFLKKLGERHGEEFDVRSAIFGAARWFVSSWILILPIAVILTGSFLFGFLPDDCPNDMTIEEKIECERR